MEIRLLLAYFKGLKLNRNKSELIEVDYKFIY